jgi:hypothetical protein
MASRIERLQALAGLAAAPARGAWGGGKASGPWG